MEELAVYNSETLNLTPFCPVNIKIDHDIPTQIVVHSLCQNKHFSDFEDVEHDDGGSGGDTQTSILYFFDTNIDNINRNFHIETYPEIA
jgi:hypothetical protein